MVNNKICFACVYNFRYDSNIEKLERIYQDKFDDIFHLVPFYDGDKANVIPVYEYSHYFQGFFAQAWRRLYDEKYSHYVFIADDLILNPRLNSGNLLDTLGVGEDSAYIKQLDALSDYSFKWFNFGRVLGSLFRAQDDGVLDYYLKQMPGRDEANALFKSHGIEMKKISWEHLRSRSIGMVEGSKDRYDFSRALRSVAFLIKHRQKTEIPYPLAVGYSDFIIVPKAALKRFAEICGFFAAMNIWVEIAAPTALVLANKKIVQEKDTAWRGTELWWHHEQQEFLSRYDFNFKKVLDSYGEHQLYTHPIKLSHWKADEL